MAYITAIPQRPTGGDRVDSIPVLFQGDGGEKDLTRLAPPNVDLAAWAKQQILVLNEKLEGKAQVVYDVPLNVADPVPTPEELAEREYQANRQQAMRDNVDVREGFLAADNAAVVALRAIVLTETTSRRAARG